MGISWRLGPTTFRIRLKQYSSWVDEPESFETVVVLCNHLTTLLEEVTVKVSNTVYEP